MLTPVIVIQLSALRVSFLSTSVLEPAATLGVALVGAVATGLTVLILAPEPYTPPLGASVSNAARARTAARSFALLDARAASSRGGPRQASSPALAAVRFEGVSLSAAGRDGLVRDGLDLELARSADGGVPGGVEPARARPRCCSGCWSRPQAVLRRVGSNADRIHRIALRGRCSPAPRCWCSISPTAHLGPRTASDSSKTSSPPRATRRCCRSPIAARGSIASTTWSAWRRMK